VVSGLWNGPPNGADNMEELEARWIHFHLMAQGKKKRDESGKKD
jgi:hypothetical protein